MRCLLCATIILAVSTVALGVEFLDTFTYADGTAPPEYTWTGDPRGGGSFSVQGEAFTHTDGGHIHFFRPGAVVGTGRYEFDVADTEWNFAWRIDAASPDAGRCLCFYHNDYWASNAYSFTEFTWSTLSGYPEGQYMWHNGSNLNIQHQESDPLVGWHHVLIVDSGGWVTISVDGDVIFDTAYELIPDGYVGVGCDGPGDMTPAFDNVSFTDEFSPVTSTTWGAIKAMYK